MKNLQKFFFLTLTILIVLGVSCSKDKDEQETVDPFIGTWKDITIYPNYLCANIDTITFAAGGGMKEIYYEPTNNPANPCVRFVDETSRWSKLSNDKYRFTYDDGEIEDFEVQFLENNQILNQIYIELYQGDTIRTIIKYRRLDL
ncbi:MAG: hypothetical protein OIF50_17825 [Flavobacteriaceae bacterium]|nr:hypothetical protein [Flavobacteriaceae bacterium]